MSVYGTQRDTSPMLAAVPAPSLPFFRWLLVSLVTDCAAPPQQELPLIPKWPGIADCLGKDHGDICWRQWDV